MFTQKDICWIDTKEYQIISHTGYHIIIKSLKTKHVWDIYCHEMDIVSIKLFHKHKDNDPFHEQPHIHPRNVAEAMEYIKTHDTWQYNKNKL